MKKHRPILSLLAACTLLTLPACRDDSPSTARRSAEGPRGAAPGAGRVQSYQPAPRVDDGTQRMMMQEYMNAQWEQERRRAQESYRQCMDSKRAMSESGSLTSATMLNCSQFLTLMSPPPVYVPQAPSQRGTPAAPPPRVMSNEEFQQIMQQVMTIP